MIDALTYPFSPSRFTFSLPIPPPVAHWLGTSVQPARARSWITSRFSAFCRSAAVVKLNEHTMTLKVADQVRMDFDRSALGRIVPAQGDKDSGS